MNRRAPNFPLTSLDRYTYPWIDPKDPNGKRVSNLDHNALTYLMITESTTPDYPAPFDQTGAYVGGTPSHDGLLCMNDDQFQAGWLLPLLRWFNQASEVQCDTTHTKCWWDGFEVAPRVTIGTNSKRKDANDAYFKFSGAPSPEGGPSFVWEGEELSSYGQDNDGGNGWNRIEVWQTYRLD